MEDENFFEKCRTCQHCYMKNDVDREKQKNCNRS